MKRKELAEKIVYEIYAFNNYEATDLPMNVAKQIALYLIEHKIEAHNWYTQFNSEVVSSDAQYIIKNLEEVKEEINKI